MKRFIPPFYLAAKVSRLSGICLVWAVLFSGICLLTSPAYPQDVLWGSTSTDGPRGTGTIFSIESTGDDFKLHHTFSRDPIRPTGSLVKGSDGYLYGLIEDGGDNKGAIFKLTPDGSVFTVLHSFKDSTDGVNPSGGLIEVNNGYLYGMTSTGGEYNAGTIFKIAFNGTGFTVLKSFNPSSDSLSSPKGSLVKGSDGYLYGLTGGGHYNAGTLFKMAVDGTGFIVLKHFGSSSTDGYGPTGLIESRNGGLYGTTEGGGENNAGTIFKTDSNGISFTVLYSFNPSTANSPTGSLLESSDSYLYGITKYGGDNGYGTIFKVSPDGTGFAVIKSYGEDTEAPVGLTEGDDGYFYGMTPLGPSYGTGDYTGTVFRISPDGTYYSFAVMEDYNGAYPVGSLIKAGNGSFYGMTQQGGNTGNGTIILTNGSGISVVRSLSSPEGKHPSSALIEGSDGYFYGMAKEGGQYGYGTIFKVAPDGSGLTVLKSFNRDTDGAHPCGSLVEGSDGFFYGMTNSGGMNVYYDYGFYYGHGTIFKIAPDGTGFSVLKRFNTLYGSSDGESPQGSLIEGSDGYLYGLASNIFKISPDGNEFSVINNSIGATYGSLLESSDGYRDGFSWDQWKGYDL